MVGVRTACTFSPLATTVKLRGLPQGWHSTVSSATGSPSVVQLGEWAPRETRPIVDKTFSRSALFSPTKWILELEGGGRGTGMDDSVDILWTITLQMDNRSLAVPSHAT